MTVNVLAATLSLAAIAFYVVVYTMWLKRSTTQNIVIGGAAGAAPALIGWAAVTGSLALPAWILFAIVFVWTPPHFWALALRFQRRLRGRGGADAAGREGRGRDPPADLPLLARAVRHDAAARAGRGHGADLPRDRGRAGRRLRLPGARAVAPGRRATARGDSSRTRSSTSPRCSAPSRSTRSSEDEVAGSPPRPAARRSSPRAPRRSSRRRSRSASCRSHRRGRCRAGTGSRGVAAVRPCGSYRLG